MSRLHLTWSCLLVAGALTLSACSNAPGDTAAPARSSSAGLPGGSVEAGETQANVKGEATGQSCIDCHGADGNQPLDATYPLIGGQHADYLAHALQQYRSGQRGNALMANQAQALTDQQIADLAAYFGAQPAQLTDLRNAY